MFLALVDVSFFDGDLSAELFEFCGVSCAALALEHFQLDLELDVRLEQVVICFLNSCFLVVAVLEFLFDLLDRFLVVVALLGNKGFVLVLGLELGGQMMELLFGLLEFQSFELEELGLGDCFLLEFIVVFFEQFDILAKFPFLVFVRPFIILEF